MSWRGLKHKGTEVLRSSEWNAVIDALDDLYNMIQNSVVSGEGTITTGEIRARTASFEERPTVGGKPVIVDGDPVGIDRFSDTAVDQITRAINTSWIIIELAAISATRSVTAGENTSGVSLYLNKGGRPNVNIYYSLSGAGNIYVEVSLDNNTWRQLDMIQLTSSGSGIKTYQGIAYPYIRVRTDATGIDVEFEIVASR
jgi:hypothetical protein